MKLKRVTRGVTAVTRRTLASYLVLSLAFGGLVTPTIAQAPTAADDAQPRGRTSTLLPGGRELVVGGETARGAVSAAVIVDHGVATPLPMGLADARAWHTATILPDGRVLVHGGLGTGGRVVLSSEIYDPASQTFKPIATGLSPRGHHTATLLTDGQVLVVGGISPRGDLLPTGELWDPRTGSITLIDDQLRTARARHTATLLGDGRVLIAQGVDAQGIIPSESELFDPVTRRFELAQPPIVEAPTGLPAILTASVPAPGAVDVPVDAVMALRFSRPLRVESLTTDDVILSGPAGPQSLSIVPAEVGTLVFVTPTAPLVPRSAYTLTLHNVTDVTGLPVAPFTIEFTTAGLPEAGASAAGAGAPALQKDQRPRMEAGDDEEWLPGGRPSTDWKTGRNDDASARSLPPLQAPPGVTALAGQVLRLNGQPLPNVSLRINRVSTRTDATGRFLLTGATPGVSKLVIDGRPASAADRTYGRFAVNVELKSGQTVVLPYTIWLPKLDTANAVRIPTYTTSEVVVTTPQIPGLEVRIPPHAWIRDEDGRPVTEITITPIPLDRPPFPLPAGVQVPLYFTVQPGGAYIYSRDGSGARLIYPNSLGKPAHQKFEFWDYDAERKGWYIYGLGTVTDDGRQVVPDPGVAIYEFSGAMVADPSDAPAQGPPPGTTGRGNTQVDLATGLFVLQKTDLYLRDLLPITLTRTYRPQDTLSRAFGIGATHPYEMFITGNSNPYTWVDVVLPDGGRVHFDRTSPGTGYADAVFEHASSPSAFYKARITWNGAGWDVTLKNGTVYVFTNGTGAPLNAIRDRNGNTLTLSRQFGVWGRVTRITTPNGRWAEFTYDASSRVTQVKDVIGRTVTYGYDSSGRLASVTDPGGGVTQYTYDGSHRMLTLRDPRGIVFLTNEYDASSRATRQTRADGTTFQFAYTLDGGTGKITQADVTDPRAFVRRVAFNAGGYVSANTRALGTAIQQTTSYERQAATNLITAIVDSLGRRLEHTYDAMGNILATTRLAGTPDAVTTTFTYEPVFNQVLSVTNPLGHTMTFGYDSRGNVLTTQDPLGNTTTLTYNAAGQPLTKQLPGDAVPTSYTYEFGDLVVVTDPLANQTRRFVDTAGRTASVTDPLGRQRRYDWDALDRLVRFTDPLAGVTTLTHDGNDNLLSLTDPPRQIGGTTTSGITGWTPDTMVRLDTRTDPLGRSERSTYDAAGNPATFTDRKGQVASITYDALNRLVQTTYGDGSTTSYAWDVGNRVTQVVDSLSGTITRAYDALDRLTQETTPQGSVSYTYDRASRRTAMTVAGQPMVSYNYDNANRLTQITQAASVVTFEYDGAGRRTRLALPNGVSTEYTYDAASRLTGLTYKRGSTVLGTLAYGYDAAGKRRQASGTWARTGMPPAVATATYNAANQQVTFGTQSLTYDLNGSLVSQGDTTYAWDARGRLIAITGPALTASFQYDPFGRRTQKTINGATSAYLYDGWTPVQEQTGATIANLLTGTGVDEYLTRTDGTGRRSVLTDVIGSTIALTDDTGNVVTEYTYDPFGATTATGEASANAFQYTGRENDSATGLYYYRTRYYSPSLHRFISEDRVDVTPWETNLYAYVGNDPLGFIDPYGEFATGVAAGLAIVVEAALLIGVLKILGILDAIVAALQAAMEAFREALAAAAAGAMAAAVGGGGKSGGPPRTLLPPKGEDPGDDGESPGQRNPKDLKKDPGAIARDTGLTVRKVLEKIHAAKDNLPRGGLIRNPDVFVDTKTGEIFPETPGGGIGDSIGNIFD